MTQEKKDGGGFQSGKLDHIRIGLRRSSGTTKENQKNRQKKGKQGSMGKGMREQDLGKRKKLKKESW